MTSPGSVESLLAAALRDQFITPALPEGVALRSKTMTDTPDQQVCITVYRASAHPTIRMDRYGCQLRYRGTRDDTFDPDELAGPVAVALLGITNLDLGNGIEIDQILFRSSMPMGYDPSNRWERSDTFDIDLCPPADPYRLT